MKITDISSSDTRDDSGEKQEERIDEGSQRKRTLMERYDIPVEQLDFDYVKKCTEVGKLEKIVKILRSGEEGVYLALQNCAEKRLEELNPQSKLLRVETPALRSSELNKDQRESISNGLTEWLNAFSAEENHSNEHKLRDIFSRADDVELHNGFPLPVRGSTSTVDAAATTEISEKKFPLNDKAGQRIKSWEYDKWDKFDVDAELTKMDITDMQVEQWEQQEKPKVIKKQREISKLMKTTDDDDDTQQEDDFEVPDLEELDPVARTNVNRPSYIEEIDHEDDEEGITVRAPVHNCSSFRKTRIVIDDLNLAM